MVADTTTPDLVDAAGCIADGGQGSPRVRAWEEPAEEVPAGVRVGQLGAPPGKAVFAEDRLAGPGDGELDREDGVEVGGGKGSGRKRCVASGHAGAKYALARRGLNPL